jgi:hypothetical protein
MKKMPEYTRLSKEFKKSKSVTSLKGLPASIVVLSLF